MTHQWCKWYFYLLYHGIICTSETHHDASQWIHFFTCTSKAIIPFIRSTSKCTNVRPPKILSAWWRKARVAATLPKACQAWNWRGATSPNMSGWAVAASALFFCWHSSQAQPCQISPGHEVPEGATEVNMAENEIKNMRAINHFGQFLRVLLLLPLPVMTTTTCSTWCTVAVCKCMLLTTFEAGIRSLKSRAGQGVPNLVNP